MFKVGDRVRVKADGSIGTVVRVPNGWPHLYWVDVYEVTIFCLEHELEKVEE